MRIAVVMHLTVKMHIDAYVYCCGAYYEAYYEHIMTHINMPIMRHIMSIL